MRSFADVDRMTSPLQIGQAAMRVARELGLEALDRALPELREALPDRPDAIDALAARVEAVRRLIRARVREDFERRNPDRLELARSADDVEVTGEE